VCAHQARAIEQSLRERLADVEREREECAIALQTFRMRDELTALHDGNESEESKRARRAQPDLISKYEAASAVERPIRERVARRTLSETLPEIQRHTTYQLTKLNSEVERMESKVETRLSLPAGVTHVALLQLALLVQQKDDLEESIRALQPQGDSRADPEEGV
jgi:hypothetical protein